MQKLCMPRAPWGAIAHGCARITVDEIKLDVSNNFGGPRYSRLDRVAAVNSSSSVGLRPRHLEAEVGNVNEIISTLKYETPLENVEYK